MDIQAWISMHRQTCIDIPLARRKSQTHEVFNVGSPFHEIKTAGLCLSWQKNMGAQIRLRLRYELAAHFFCRNTFMGCYLFGIYFLLIHAWISLTLAIGYTLASEIQLREVFVDFTRASKVYDTRDNNRRAVANKLADVLRDCLANNRWASRTS